jgi:hypothetical protein
MQTHLLLASLLSCSFALAQSTIYVPDNMSAVGTCNAIPLDSTFATATTYVGRIPASFMGTSPVSIQDIQFAPCNTATFTAANMQIGIGHVPSLTTSITFPTFDAGGNMIALARTIHERGEVREEDRRTWGCEANQVPRAPPLG